MSFNNSNKLKRKLAADHISVSWESHLCCEILEILLAYYFLKQQSPNYDDSLSNLGVLKFMQLLHNDIILRLCKFRDKDSRSISFEQVKKKLEKKTENKNRYPHLDKMIKKYRELTINLENHRNSYIAHLSKSDKVHLKPTTEILTAIKMAVKIADDLVGAKNNFRVENIDLRVEILGDSAT